ncbi:hypothetical protein [Desulfovibrio litoralis]|uniref:Uncharacterized protein n=1 Tax=Desulfovibrio litoralis DSM 11393 TaxID=1121455 RepID=A0A1M7T800_9BACT|nr:hypothetical protein [Desulfovibrio litoralis]SHN66861.1 hypothetical protein SAMN02745728_01702 [Desulfovibrio litoralis DSM 11393]
MSFTNLQGAFTAGELSPALQGRIDLSKYAQGCKNLTNMLVQPHGGAIKRTGFKLLDEIDGEAVLIPFVFNSNQAYCLVFGEKWLRIATKDGFIYKDDTIYQIASPYTLKQAKQLSYAQSADVLFIAMQEVKPQKLKRLAHDNWIFEDISFLPDINPPKLNVLADMKLQYAKSFPLYTRRLGDVNGIIGGGAGDYDLLDHENLYIKGSGTRTDGFVLAYPKNTIYETSSGHYRAVAVDLYEADTAKNNIKFVNEAKKSDGSIQPAQVNTPYAYYITAVNEKNKESAASLAINTTAPASNNWSAGDYVEIYWDVVPGAVEYRIYKSTFGGSAGFIGTASKTLFRDYNIQPVSSDSYPRWLDPFPENDYPATVCFFEQRLVFASSIKRPQTIWMSKSGDYDNFSSSIPLKADDSIELTIASNEVSNVCWLIPLRSLILGAAGMEWELSSSEGAFTAKTAKATPQSYRGSAAHLRAIVIGDTVLHITRSGRQVRDLKYDFAADSYGGSDRTILASHLFENQRIISWTYQPSPHSIVWCVRNDGVLLGLTFQAEHEIFAWHKHTTQGLFKTVCSVPQGQDDCLFVTTRRNNKHFLEVLAENDSELVNLNYLDCSLQYKGKATRKVIGLEHLEGLQVSALADGSSVANRKVINGSIELEHEASNIIVGLPYNADLETMPVEMIRRDGASLGRKKYINAVNVLFKDTVTAKIGCNFDKLEEVKWRTTEAYDTALKPYSGQHRVIVPEYAKNQITVCVRSSEPLPMTILALMPEMDVN